MTSIRLLPADDAVDASVVVDSILRKHASGDPSDALMKRDHAALWSALSEGGWFLLGVREEKGGAGFDLVDLAPVAEAWGRYLVPLPFIPTLLVSRWCGGVPSASGRDRLTYCLPAAGAASVTRAPFAPAPLVEVVTRLSPFSASASRFADGAVHQWAPSLPIGTGGEPTANLPDAALREIAVLGAAELVGSGQRLIERCVSYARERVQFGQPIVEFQAVRHLLANMHRNVEMARTAYILAANEPGHASHAVKLAWDNVRQVTEIAVQIHGGFGFTWEAGLHFYERHVWAWRELLDACGIPR